ncbi:hypothetical protein [Polyangium fumosum]|uniref:Uncharacterized protein n=1 Tax=Polyangium fumosum TaxID=889272 RepID=A0A4U1IUF3_9BACT|nr:hypothetical protein [Polyangium fumosum]TKC98053.1 hypothetical protein E8A74_42705 [Polyangium fumosum]
MFGSRDGHWSITWFRERVGASWYLLVPLALFVALAGGTGRLSDRTMIAFLGIVAFRLWDDVADLPHDREHHPERALCRRVSTTEPLLYALGGLAFTAASIGLTRVAIAPFLGAVLATQGGFAARAAWPHLRGLFAHVILLKVPALALSLALPDTPPFVALGRAITLYGVVAAYELVHDEDARRGPLGPTLVLVDVVCLCGGAALWLLHDRTIL